MLTVFTLASGRSGTHFLYELLRRNTRGCVCRHEPYSFANPSMFGRPIGDYAAGELEAVRRQVAIKARWIARLRGAAYAETSHAFLKSWFEVAPEFFPNLRLVHLVRNVLLVAGSEARREELAHLWRLPFRFARCSNGRQFFRWALSGQEPIFQCVSAEKLNLFQWYVVQWIEIENRAMRMLDRFGLHGRCITLHSPEDLNDAAMVTRLIEFLGLESHGAEPTLAGRKNRTPGVTTVVTPEMREQARQVISMLPAEFLAIFYRPPYVDWPWTAILRGIESSRAAATISGP